MNIYIARPISGMSGKVVFGYYDGMSTELLQYYEKVYTPVVGKAELRFEKKYKAKDFRHPVATNKAIVGRDSWMVRQCDVLFLNLLGAKDISIGCVSELAWAWLLGKHTVTVIDSENVHQHAFILQMSNIVWDNEEDAIKYLRELAIDTSV